MGEVRQLTDFVSSTLFQHYSLYQNVLVCLQESVTKHSEVVIDHPLPPPDLQRAKLRTKLAGVAGSAQSAVKTQAATLDASAKDGNSAGAPAGEALAATEQSAASGDVEGTAGEAAGEAIAAA